MENFYLVLIKKDGTIVHDIFATSHKDLINKYLTHDEIKGEQFFAAHYSPKDGCRLDDVDSYTLINSGIFYPNWFTGEFREEVMLDLKEIIGNMIVRGRKKLLLHEGVILSKMTVVDEAKHCVIFGMYDEARIDVLDEASEVVMMTDDAMIQEMRDGSKVTEMYGFSKVRQMKNYSKIVKMYGQAKVGEMHDHSRIAVLKGDANIMEMHEESQADRLKHMSRVDEMHGHSVIEEMWDWSVVEKMFDNSRINFMDEDSKVLEMYGNSMVDEMYGNAVVEKLYENSLVRKLHDMAKILEKDLGK
jgi:hypothetical protein